MVDEERVEDTADRHQKHGALAQLPIKRSLPERRNFHRKYFVAQVIDTKGFRPKILRQSEFSNLRKVGIIPNFDYASLKTQGI